MKNAHIKLILLFLGIISPGFYASAQISPGELSEYHSALEGMSNCTQCHTLGSKVSNEKCLACHSEIKSRVDAGKGYHASAAVAGKTCVSCHNDHHGRTFDIIRFEKKDFDHNLTGYKLQGAHSKKDCRDCHKQGFIRDDKIKKKKYESYLGLGTDCISCHTDYHQNTLSQNCGQCHSFESFKPASKFNHQSAKFQLLGKHRDVECIKCHKIETINGKQVQKFAGIAFTSCADCHTDVHKNQFGRDCKQCHTEESFHTILGLNNFDHDKTAYKLENKHKTVSCKSCHKTALTDPLKHDRCADCHKDYHNGQFQKDGISPDCASCHDTRGFNLFSYTIEQHDQSVFPLQGAHIATPCFVCHKKTDRWNFRGIGIRCHDCHEDIHDPYLDKKYYPGEDCRVCHSTESWHNIMFDHDRTQFALVGVHKQKTCRDCHFKPQGDGTVKQQFSGLGTSCTNCHQDVHVGQFEENGITDCNRCHGFDNWKAGKFDHNLTQFPLDGKHINVACDKCHKKVESGEKNYILYKITDFKCVDCHH